MDYVVGLAILVEGGVQQVQNAQEVQHGDRPALIIRERGSQMQPREGATIVSSSALDFFRRLITRLTEYITRIRRFFVFTLAKDGNPQVKKERGVTAKVEEAACGACEPQLTEIIVSEKEKTVELLDHEDCGSNYTRQITEQSGTSCQGDNPTLLADNHGAACQIEYASPSEGLATQNPTGVQQTVEPLDYEDCRSNCTRKITELSGTSCDGDNPTDNHGAACASPSEQAMRDPDLQKPANSATCEPGMVFSPELNDGNYIAQHENCHSQEQDASREEELRIRNNCLTIEAPSGACDSKLETFVEESALEQVASSKSVNKKKLSIHQLNAIMVEQFTKYLQALERSMVPAATLNQKAMHWRAIILATLVAVAVWARNSKHLHESMPSIRGSSINVHIRSRL